MRTKVATRLLALILSLRYVARIATDRSDKVLSQRQWFSHVTRGDLLQQPVAATCRSDSSHRVSRPLISKMNPKGNKEKLKIFQVDALVTLRNAAHLRFKYFSVKSLVLLPTLRENLLIRYIFTELHWLSRLHRRSKKQTKKTRKKRKSKWLWATQLGKC